MGLQIFNWVIRSFVLKEITEYYISNYCYNKSMLSPPTWPRKCSNLQVQSLVLKMNQTQGFSELEKEKKIQETRKIYHSASLEVGRRLKMARRPVFNNNTKEGDLIDKEVKSIPYMFIPAFKNNTFIMPDRVLEKGEAAKRLEIKMKDSSVFSFRNVEDETTRRTIRKDQKEKTIISRQVEEYNRIIDQNDGIRRNQINKWFLKNRKKFYPTNNASELISEQIPMLEPKDEEFLEMRKTNLARRFNHDSRWRPFTRGSESFATSLSSFYSNQKQTFSVR